MCVCLNLCGTVSLCQDDNFCRISAQLAQSRPVKQHSSLKARPRTDSPTCCHVSPLNLSLHPFLSRSPALSCTWSMTYSSAGNLMQHPPWIQKSATVKHLYHLNFGSSLEALSNFVIQETMLLEHNCMFNVMNPQFSLCMINRLEQIVLDGYDH